MVRNFAVRASSPAIAEMVTELLDEDRRRVQVERRSVHREPFVRPVTAVFSESPNHRVNGFTKNISPLGVGVILPGPIPEGSSVRLFIHRFGRPPSCVVCECRWCDEFGEGWYTLGMNFMHVSPREELRAQELDRSLRYAQDYASED